MASRIREALRASFLERSPRVIGSIAVAVVVSGSAFALLLSGGVFADQYRISAQFTDAAGIQAGDEVTVAGLEAGAVKATRIEGDRVILELGIDRGIELSPDTRAEVVIETLLGRRSVNLIDGTGRGAMGQGDVIPVDRTTTPIDITELNDISVDLLEESDMDALNAFLAEVATIASGKDDEVGRILTGLADVAEAVDGRRQELSRLIDSLRVLSTTLGERDDTIVSLIDHLDAVLANLDRHQDDLVRLLEATDSASHETADLIRRNRALLDATLGSLHTDLTVLDRHQVDLAATISYLEQAVEGYASVGYSSGVPNRWANIFVQSLGPLGVDAILGQCGAVDQLIDDLLGTDCAASGNQEGGGAPGGPNDPGSPGGTIPPGGDGSQGGLPGSEGPGQEEEPLPGTIEDLIEDVIGGGDLGGGELGGDLP
ncbi:MAG: MCE family protein [Actinobacteria bacterium]|nr:MCE family protein [Actinomycetota bacterium]